MNLYWFVRHDDYEKQITFLFYPGETEKEARQVLMRDINEKHDNIYNAMQELEQISYVGGFGPVELGKLIDKLELMREDLENRNGLAEYESN